MKIERATVSVCFIGKSQRVYLSCEFGDFREESLVMQHLEDALTEHGEQVGLVLAQVHVSHRHVLELSIERVYLFSMVVLRKALACLLEKQCHPYLLLEPVSIVRCNLVVEVRHADFLDELGHTLRDSVHIWIDDSSAVCESLQVSHHVPSLEASCFHGCHVL